ncbi:oligosaccharide flippase family protein, partial [Candidatus Peribacteria bacterium]|nr:oligosaccharide flippase family protein [Candidatus Peribacteria bacterium]
MQTRKIATSTFWQLGSQAVAMLIGILSIKFVTTALSKSMVGNYQTVYSYLQIFGILADFGLYAIAIRELSTAKDKAKTFVSLFFLRAFITVLSLGSALALVWALPVFSGTPLPIGVSIAALVPFFTLLAGMFRVVFQVSYKMQYVFISEVIGKILPVTLMAIVVFTGMRGSENIEHYKLILAFGSIGSITLFILSFWFASRLPLLSKAKNSDLDNGLLSVCTGLSGWFAKFDKQEFGRLLRLSAPFGFAFLMTTIYRQSDVTLMAILRPNDYDIQNAYYGTVLRLADVGFLIPTFILNSALPMMSNLEGKKEELNQFVHTLLYSLLSLGLIISLTSYFWARPIVRLITRESYLSTPVLAGSDTALELLSFSMFLSSIVTFCFYILLTRRSWRRLLVVMTVASVISVGLNIVLIPMLGFVGAALTSIIVHIVLSISLSTIVFGLPGVFSVSKATFHGATSNTFARLVQFAKLVAFGVIYSFLLVWTVPLLSGPITTVLMGGVMMCVAGGLVWGMGLIGGQRSAIS